MAVELRVPRLASIRSIGVHAIVGLFGWRGGPARLEPDALSGITVLLSEGCEEPTDTYMVPQRKQDAKGCLTVSEIGKNEVRIPTIAGEWSAAQYRTIAVSQCAEERPMLVCSPTENGYVCTRRRLLRTLA
jgi:hypothetical protein